LHQLLSTIQRSELEQAKGISVQAEEIESDVLGQKLDSFKHNNHLLNNEIANLKRKLEKRDSAYKQLDTKDSIESTKAREHIKSLKNEVRQLKRIKRINDRDILLLNTAFERKTAKEIEKLKKDLARREVKLEKFNQITQAQQDTNIQKISKIKTQTRELKIIGKAHEKDANKSIKELRNWMTGKKNMFNKLNSEARSEHTRADKKIDELQKELGDIKRTREQHELDTVNMVDDLEQRIAKEEKVVKEISSQIKMGRGEHDIEINKIKKELADLKNTRRLHGEIIDKELENLENNLGERDNMIKNLGASATLDKKEYNSRIKELERELNSICKSNKIHRKNISKLKKRYDKDIEKIERKILTLEKVRRL
ncbi:hypothetical protein KY320_04210, partial [Candidatus Woesearchaeota archaeon]|nr:hypothetical protein [Candidatus Woesearchaeota archaeon]